MFKVFTFFALMLVSISLLPAQQSFAAASVGRVAHTYGSAWIERGHQLDKLEKGQVVLRNDSIITGTRGRVKIVMRDGSKIYVGAKSRISLRQYSMKKDKLFSATIHMLWGKTRFFVNKLTTKNASFKVNTPTAVLGVRGTEFIVSVPATPELLAKALQHITLADVPALPTRTALIEGAVQVSSGVGKPILLRPGNTADIGANKEIHTFKTSSDDIDNYEQDLSLRNTPQDKKTKKPLNDNSDEEDSALTPPPAFNKGEAPSHMNKDKRRTIKKHLASPTPSDATNAIQNLNSTTDVTFKTGFVK